MNYLKRGFSGSVKAIKEHKRLFVLLAVLQLIFVVSVIGVSIYFQLKIFEDARGIIEPLQNANYDADSIEEGTPFTKDMLNIYQSYVSMRKNVIVFLITLFLLYIILNGGIWIMTHALLGNLDLRKIKDIFLAWLKLASSLLVILGPFILISYYLLISMLQKEAAEAFSKTANILIYVLLALYYLIIAAFTLAYNKQWMIFIKKIYLVSIKKFFKSLPVLIINLAALSILGYFVYFTVNSEQSFSLLILSSILFILGLVVTRIFLTASLREIHKETHGKIEHEIHHH